MERKFVVCRSLGEGVMPRVYWNVEKKSWGPLHHLCDDRGFTVAEGATVFQTFEAADQEASALSVSDATAAPIWTDE
jgi:hypothetical protein